FVPDSDRGRAFDLTLALLPVHRRGDRRRAAGAVAERGRHAADRRIARYVRRAHRAEVRVEVGTGGVGRHLIAGTVERNVEARLQREVAVAGGGIAARLGQVREGLLDAAGAVRLQLLGLWGGTVLTVAVFQVRIELRGHAHVGILQDGDFELHGQHRRA